MKTIRLVILVQKIARSVQLLEFDQDRSFLRTRETLLGHEWHMAHRGLSRAVRDVRSREVSPPHPMDPNPQRERNGTGHDATQADGAGS